VDQKYKRELIHFYFSFNDPYSFLIFPMVKNLSQNYKVDIEMISVTAYDRDTLFSADETLASYYLSDVLRYSGKLGRTLNFMPQFQDATKASLGKFLADNKMLSQKYINLVFAARWINGKDISSTQDLVNGLKFLELGEERLREALESAEYLQQQKQVEVLADSNGVRGVPFFRFRNEEFMGPDRLEFLEDVLKSDPSLVIHHDASYGVIKPEELGKYLASPDSIVLDVRIPKSFGAGHIPGSNCLPARVVHRNLDRLDREWNLAIVDDGGVEATDVAFYLASNGFGKVSVLSGGISDFKGEMSKGLKNWQDRLLKK
tara:strand:+ start:54823 stop:55773 length:951 start_codon:yes stop_codon:yes gene_type:complete